MSKKDALLQALNRMDEWASAYTVDNNEIEESDIGEAEQLDQDYTLLSDFILASCADDTVAIESPKQKMSIPFSSEDLRELSIGGEFDWTFKTDKGESIDVHLYNEEEEEEEEDEN